MSAQSSCCLLPLGALGPAGSAVYHHCLGASIPVCAKSAAVLSVRPDIAPDDPGHTSGPKIDYVHHRLPPMLDLWQPSSCRRLLYCSCVTAGTIA